MQEKVRVSFRQWKISRTRTNWRRYLIKVEFNAPACKRNFPGDAVAVLHDANHDVFWVCTDAPGGRDEDIRARARTEKRVLITFDQDFGELAFRAKRPADCGIILFQIAIRSSTFFAQLAVNTIDSRAD